MLNPITCICGSHPNTDRLIDSTENQSQIWLPQKDNFNFMSSIQLVDGVQQLRQQTLNVYHIIHRYSPGGLVLIRTN